MRYYQSFPTAIPQYEAGYPRVTHPSATKWFKWIQSEQALQVFWRTTPFDLHVLSTPPAFILSQDQTLKKSLLVMVIDYFIIDNINVNVLPFPKIYCSYLDSFNSEYSLCSKSLRDLQSSFAWLVSAFASTNLLSQMLDYKSSTILKEFSGLSSLFCC